jgi:hypothetical protein
MGGRVHTARLCLGSTWQGMQISGSIRETGNLVKNQQALWRAWSNICDAGTHRIGGSDVAEKQTLSRFISALSVEHHISLGAGYQGRISSWNPKICGFHGKHLPGSPAVADKRYQRID